MTSAGVVICADHSISMHFFDLEFVFFFLLSFFLIFFLVRSFVLVRHAQLNT